MAESISLSNCIYFLIYHCQCRRNTQTRWLWVEDSMADGIDRFRRFLCELTNLCDAGADETAIRERGGASLRDLVAEDDWLPAEFCEPDPAQYRQYLLYCDPLERFSVVSFVWGPGQRTP